MYQPAKSPPPLDKSRLLHWPRFCAPTYCSSVSASSRNSSLPTGARAPTPRRSKRAYARTRAGRRSRRSASCTTRPRPARSSPVAEVRKAIDAAGHPALLLVDTVYASLASADYRHDEWGVDVSVGGAQKGLMYHPGMSFNAISDEAIAANKTSKMPKSFFAWDDMLNMNKVGFFPYAPGRRRCCTASPATRRSRCCTRKRLDNVFARHNRLADHPPRCESLGIRQPPTRTPPNIRRPSPR